MSATFEPLELSADRLPGDVLLVPLFEDQRPLAGPAAVVDWRTDGALTRMIRHDALSGRYGECFGLQANARFASAWIVLVGGGRWQSLDRERYRVLVGKLLDTAERAGMRDVALCLPPRDELPPAALAALVKESLAGRKRMAHCRFSSVAGLR